MMHRAYYAHCVALYNTHQERRDVETLLDLGMEVINPNSPRFQTACDRINKDWPERGTPGHYLQIYKDAGEAIMRVVFRAFITPGNLDLLAFRALPDGRIPSGVAAEIQWAIENKIPVIELPSNMITRTMTLPQTREYLREVGHR